MPKAPYKYKLIPAKLLLFMLYGQYSWLDRKPGGSIMIRLGPLRRTVSVSASRLREAIIHLQKVGIIRSIDFSYGKALITLNRPLIDWEGVEATPEGELLQFGHKTSLGPTSKQPAEVPVSSDRSGARVERAERGQ